MSFLILVRHGQSTWNLEKRFTGWVDVDLTENGKLEAKKAGELIKKMNIKIENNYYPQRMVPARLRPNASNSNPKNLMKDLMERNKEINSHN